MNHLSLALLRSQRRHLRPCLSASSPGKGVNCVTIRRLPGPSSTTSSSLSTTRRSFTSEDMTASVHKDILEKVASGELSCDDALQQLAATTTISSSQAPQPPPTASSNEQVLESYANLDHTRQIRTGFPEAVFAEGKTSTQVHAILDNMAQNVNKNPQSISKILATRVTPEMYQELATMTYEHGTIEYYETARIVSIQPHITATETTTTTTSEKVSSSSSAHVVVATAGTTDLPVAEEAAVTLEATGHVTVDRINDVGVAGLHRVLRSLPRLQKADCVIVCAGMDGALPSVMGGLVKVPVIATPTSIGYGASFGGVSAMLTMLNSCSPGVGVVNIDNGFGAAALAYKIVQPNIRGR